MKVAYKVKCNICRNEHELKADPEDIQAWQEGELIQRALPYLKPAERELLMSKTCNDCFNKLFPDE